MGNVGYAETSNTSRLFGLLGIGMVLGSVGTATALITAPPSPGSEPASSDTVIAAVTLVLIAVLGVGLAVARITVTLDIDLTVRMSPFWYRKRIDPGTVTDAVPIDIRAQDWGGWGVRFGTGRGTAVLMDDGPGVRLSIRGRRDLWLRCRDPERLIAALAARGATTSTQTRTEHR
jgi:hypothetical protein